MMCEKSMICYGEEQSYLALSLVCGRTKRVYLTVTDPRELKRALAVQMVLQDYTTSRSATFCKFLLASSASGTVPGARFVD